MKYGFNLVFSRGFKIPDFCAKILNLTTSIVRSRESGSLREKTVATISLNQSVLIHRPHLIIRYPEPLVGA
jgi:hypothetical protein